MTTTYDAQIHEALQIDARLIVAIETQLTGSDRFPVVCTFTDQINSKHSSRIHIH